jgi:hypothetical protein
MKTQKVFPTDICRVQAYVDEVLAESAEEHRERGDDPIDGVVNQSLRSLRSSAVSARIISDASQDKANFYRLDMKTIFIINKFPTRIPSTLA